MDQILKCKPSPAAAPSERECRAALARIQQDPLFASSPRLKRLLVYLVEHSLAGEERDLLEFSVGMEVFDRGCGFDPHHDTIVRVTAARLRERLAKYYAGRGQSDPVRLSLPKGHYRVEFQHLPSSTTPPLTARTARRRMLAGAATAVCALVLGLGASGLQWPVPPLPGDDAGLLSPDLDAHLATGQHLFTRRGPGDVRAARAEFERALAIDPTSVTAWVGLASSLKILGQERQLDYRESLLHQQTALTAALNLEPEHADANLRMSHVQHMLGNRQLAARYLGHAQRHGDNSALVQSVIAGKARESGDLATAIRLQRRAVALDPLAMVSHANLGHYLAQAGRYEEALECLRQARLLAQGPATGLDHDIARILLLLERDQEVEAILARLPPGPAASQVGAMLHHARGRYRQAGEILQQLAPATSPKVALMLAEAYAYRGELDLAMEQVQRAYRLIRASMGDGYRSALEADRLLRASPFLAALHSDSRWSNWSSEVDGLLLANRLPMPALAAWAD